MSKFKNFNVKINEVLKGSVYLNNTKKNIDKDEYMISNMEYNLSYKNSFEKNNNINLLDDFKRRFKKYREDWNLQPKTCIEKKLLGPEMTKEKIIPLCVDIEVASICDLACPFCYREFIVTPDKIINEKLCYELIDQASDMGVPSMKFNWRGEPLLNPKIYEYINYAKKKGILETIINTNATNLTETNSKRLIDSGLDLMIYSFDGGTKKTYEKMRPGRFSKNSFDKVFENIKNFKKLRTSLGSKFPFTKIQMILTKETINEVNEFYDNFGDIVDNVTVNQYTERGGDIKDLNEEEKKRYKKILKDKNLPIDTPYLRDIEGNIKLATGREPCKQPFQRLLVTYEGKVAMCCYDWGASHPVGFTDKKAFNNSADYNDVLQKIKNKKKGFELLKEAKLSAEYNRPKKELNNLKNIWNGLEIDKVRSEHLNNRSDKVSICSKCSFKDVYKWEN